jgi:hypothetical protein
VALSSHAHVSRSQHVVLYIDGISVSHVTLAHGMRPLYGGCISARVGIHFLSVNISNQIFTIKKSEKLKFFD